jgi:thiol-disulfide isomerase/thioredoxin
MPPCRGRDARGVSASGIPPDAVSRSCSIEIAADFVLDVSWHGPLGGFPPLEPVIRGTQRFATSRFARLVGKATSRGHVEAARGGWPPSGTDRPAARPLREASRPGSLPPGAGIPSRSSHSSDLLALDTVSGCSRVWRSLPGVVPVDIRMSWVIVAVVALFGGAAFVARADEPAAVAGGETAPASSAELPSARSLDGQDVSFADLLGGDGKAVCYAFLHPTCPLAQRYAPVLAELDKEFDEQGVHFVGVVCEFDDVDEITGYRDEYAIHFPFLTDRDFHLADALDATTTPEVVLVDAGGRIRYQGRIDDRYKVRGEKSPGTPEPDLKNAILDLLAGREVQLPVTEAVGCPLDRPEVPTTPPQPHHEITYAEDVLPFLHAQCQRCHSPGQAGPFTLTSYDDAVDWMEQAIEEIEARRMPPAQVESDFELLDTKPPTAEQLAMLREWVKTDMPAGDPAKTPKLPPLPDYGAFQEDLGPPDIVLEQQSPTQCDLFAGQQRGPRDPGPPVSAGQSSDRPPRAYRLSPAGVWGSGHRGLGWPGWHEPSG